MTEDGKELDAVGLGVTAFAGHCVFQVCKPVQQVITGDFTPCLSSYSEGGFEQKMSRPEAILI